MLKTITYEPSEELIKLFEECLQGRITSQEFKKQASKTEQSIQIASQIREEGHTPQHFSMTKFAQDNVSGYKLELTYVEL